MSYSRTSRGVSRRGFTLIEILIASVVLAFAMIPVFGLMTTGLVRTDVNVGFTNAQELASGLMNHILSEETSFASLPMTSGTVEYPAPRGGLQAAAGNVAASAALDRLFPAPDWSVNTTAGTRDIRINGITYHVWLWIAPYPVGSLSFGHFENPVLDFRLDGPTRFDLQKTLTGGDYLDGFAPWSPQNIDPDPTQVFPSNPASRIVSNPWGRVEVVYAEDALTETPGASLAKVLLRVSWGEDGRRGRGSTKDFWLVSLKADLQR